MFYNRQTREYPVQVRPTFNRPQFNTFNRSNTMNSLNSQMQHQVGYNSGTWGWSGLNSPTGSPATDILELDDQYVLEIALPGVVVDDVELKVEENLLTVIAKRTPNMFEERATLLHKELNCGYLVRHFEFETPIILEHIEARMDRGILFVSVPKMEIAHRIPVSAGSIESHLGNRTRVAPKSEAIRSGKEVTVK